MAFYGFLPISIINYIRSFGLRAVLPDFSQYAICRNFPFSKTDFILIAPPQRLVITLVPSRRAFFDTLPAICYSSNQIFNSTPLLYPFFLC